MRPPASSSTPVSSPRGSGASAGRPVFLGDVQNWRAARQRQFAGRDQQAQVGLRVRAVASYVDGQGTAESVASAATTAPPAPPLILFISGAPSHGPGEHRFPEGCRLLADALNRSGLPLRATVSLGWPAEGEIAAAAALVRAKGRLGALNEPLPMVALNTMLFEDGLFLVPKVIE